MTTVLRIAGILAAGIIFAGYGMLGFFEMDQQRQGRAYLVAAAAGAAAVMIIATWATN